MPVPNWVARANRVGFNRLARHFAPWLPGFGLIVHRGRRSGRTYRTPVMLFRSADGYVVALLYGPNTDYVRNVVAAGGAEVRTRGRRVLVGSPRIYHDGSRRSVGPIVGQALRAINVADFLGLETLRRV